MKKLIIILAVLLNAKVYSIKDNLWHLRHLDKNQLLILQQTWNYARQYNLQYTMTAIVWQESDFGKYLINLQDPSCGYFHKLLPEYAKELGLRPNNWNMSRVCQQLLHFDTSFMVALQTLKQKEQQCKIMYGYSDKMLWRCMVVRYNGKGKKARVYYRNIVNKIKALKIFMKEYR